MAIDWSIIKSPETQGIPVPQTVGLTEGIMKGLAIGAAAKQAAAQRELMSSQQKLLEAQTAKEKISGQAEQEKLKVLPQELQLAQQQQKQALGIGAIEQRSKLQDMDAKQLTAKRDEMAFVNTSTGALKNVQDKDFPAAYDLTMQQYKKRGIDTSGMPDTFAQNPKMARLVVDKAFATSSWGENKFENALKTQQLVAQAQAKGMGDIEKVKLTSQSKLASAVPIAYGKRSGEDFAAMQTEANKIAVGAQEQKVTINNLRNSIKGAVVKGPLYPKFLAGMFPGGAKAFKEQATLVIDTIKSLKGAGNRVMATEFAVLDKMFPTITTNPRAATVVLNWLDAANARSIEYSKFVNVLQRKGVNNIGIVSDLWNKFIDQNPFVTKDGVVDKERIYKWREYVTDKALKNIDQPSSISKTVTIPDDFVDVTEQNK